MESREQRIKRYLRLTKKDLAIMLVDTQICLETVCVKKKDRKIYVSGKRS